MSWQRQDTDPVRYLYIIDGQTIAEVSFEQGSRWQWHRYTTVSQHGVPGDRGCENSREMAQREALRGVQTAKAHNK